MVGVMSSSVSSSGSSSSTTGSRFVMVWMTMDICTIPSLRKVGIGLYELDHTLDQNEIVIPILTQPMDR